MVSVRTSTWGTSLPRYAPAFREEAVRLVTTSGKPVAAIARDSGVSYETLLPSDTL